MYITLYFDFGIVVTDQPDMPTHLIFGMVVADAEHMSAVSIVIGLVGFFENSVTKTV
jgi:hypothetical protein